MFERKVLELAYSHQSMNTARVTLFLTQILHMVDIGNIVI